MTGNHLIITKIDRSTKHTNSLYELPILKCLRRLSITACHCFMTLHDRTQRRTVQNLPMTQNVTNVTDRVTGRIVFCMAVQLCNQLNKSNFLEVSIQNYHNFTIWWILVSKDGLSSIYAHNQFYESLSIRNTKLVRTKT